MAKVSVVIPAYNCERYIKETIESALSQTYKDIELIVVDDGSTDGTGEIVKSFSSKLKYVPQNKNTGPSAARNEGIKMATGEYVAFLDHDDVWMPNKIERQIRLFEDNGETALTYSNYLYVGQSGKEMGTLFDTVRPHRGFIFEHLILDNFVPTSSVVFKKKVLDEIGGFKERFLIAHDFELYLRIAERYKADFISTPLVRRRIYPASASIEGRKIMLEETIGIIKNYRDKINSRNPLLARRVDKRIAKYMFYIAIWFLEHGDKREAIAGYSDCIKTKAIDYKIALASLFFIMPRFVSIPLMKKLIKINRAK